MSTYVVLTVMPYTVLGQPHLLGLSAALTITGLDLLAILSAACFWPAYATLFTSMSRLGVHGLCLLSLSESATKATRRVLAACVQYLYVYAVVP